MLASARARNEAIGVTGQLSYNDGHFFQVLEGEHQAVEDLYRSIETDRRHSDLLVILDRRVMDRAFPASPMAYTARPGLPDTVQQGIATFMARVETLRSSSEEDIGGRIEPNLSTGQIRLAPNQMRAMTTVNRLFASAFHLLVRDGIKDLAMEEVASNANISRQTAYRYFGGVGDLLRTFVRRRQVHHFGAFRDYLAVHPVNGNAQFAAIVIQLTMVKYWPRNKMPRKLALHLLRHYHEVPYEDLFNLAADVRASMKRGYPSNEPVPNQVVVASALAAFASAMKMIALNDPDSMETERVQDRMTGMLLSALRAGAD